VATDISIESDELTKILELLKEYTGKLRSICEEKTSDSFRLAQIGSLAGCVVGLALAVGIALAFKRVEWPEFLLPVSIAATGVIMVFSWIYVMISPSIRFSRSYDARQVAATIERLIRTASQYNEHANRRISDRFEFDLRLAEAEGALQRYQRLFDSSVNTPFGVRILAATYGAGERMFDVTDAVAELVAAGALKIQATNDLGGDPKPGAGKFLTIVYSYKGQRRVQTVRENEVANLP
jgi:hypothetical protein